MNTENDVKEFGFRHILINTVYNVWQRSAYSVGSAVCYQIIDSYRVTQILQFLAVYLYCL